jgi:Tol biopolymer transport system component
VRNLLIFILLLPGSAAFAAGPVELVSRVDASHVSDTALQPWTALTASVPKLSADGRYAVFVSRSGHLMTGQQDLNSVTDGGEDVFLSDLTAGTTLLVSRAVGSSTRTGDRPSGSQGMVFSTDGRYVAFTSKATDLAPGQAGSTASLLLFDRVTETVALVASTRDSDGDFGSLSLSADGRYLAFGTSASEISHGDPNNPFRSPQAFLYDRVAGAMRLVSHKRGQPDTGVGGSPSSLSADGRFVVFISSGGDLAPGQKPTDSIFLYDRTQGTNVAVGSGDYGLISADGEYVLAVTFFAPFPGTGLALYSTRNRTTIPVSHAYQNPAISADGRFVAFQSGDNSTQVEVFDRVSRASTLATLPQGLRPVAIRDLSLSADGRYAAFTAAVASENTSLSVWRLFLFDRSMGKTTQVSRLSPPLSLASPGPQIFARLSANGSRIVFSSPLTDLLAGVQDLNETSDLFAYDVASRNITLLTRHAPGLPASSPATFLTQARALSADGRFVAFESDSAHLIAGQTDANGKTDIFLYDRIARTTALVSRSTASPTTTGNGASYEPQVSADGRWVAFFSEATDLAPDIGAAGHGVSLFLFDRLAGTTRWVAHAAPSAIFGLLEHRISPDGRWIVFHSFADDVIPGLQGVPQGSQVYLWDRDTGSTVLVSHSSAGPNVPGDQNSGSALLSDDGRYVAFVSQATNLIPGQTSIDGPSLLHDNTFLWDRGTGTTVLVTYDPRSSTTSVLGRSLSMSADGRFVLLVGPGSLDSTAARPSYDSFLLYDRTLGTNRQISRFQGTAQISADGRWIALTTDRGLQPGADPYRIEIHLYDRIAQTFTLVTPLASGAPGGSHGMTGLLTLSADGRYVAFESDASDLIAGQTSLPTRRDKDIFLFDRDTSTTTLVSRLSTSPATATGWSSSPLLSADGRRLAFTSAAGLVSGDFNQSPDAYLFDLDAVAPSGPVTIPPCALFDGSLRSNLQKVLAVAGGCGVPAGASRATVKVTARQGSGQGNLRLYPGDVTTTPSGTLRFQRGQTAAASFDVPLATNGAGTIAVLPFVRGNGTVRVTVEVDAYTP